VQQAFKAIDLLGKNLTSSHADYVAVAASPESEQVHGELGSFLLQHVQ
jgi:hypothetical protein